MITEQQELDLLASKVANSVDSQEKMVVSNKIALLLENAKIWNLNFARDRISLDIWYQDEFTVWLEIETGQQKYLDEIPGGTRGVIASLIENLLRGNYSTVKRFATGKTIGIRIKEKDLDWFIPWVKTVA